MWRQIRVRLRSLRHWRRRESELDEEIRFHLAEETEERVAAGMSPEQASAAARRDFGNLPLIRELTRETWGRGPAERLLQDARSAILTRGFALTAVGIAAGGLASLWAGRWVAPLLFDGRSPRDPLALGAAALVLVTAALAASLLPARRAAQADPRQALQAE